MYRGWFVGTKGEMNEGYNEGLFESKGEDIIAKEGLNTSLIILLNNSYTKLLFYQHSVLLNL